MSKTTGKRAAASGADMCAAPANKKTAASSEKIVVPVAEAAPSAGVVTALVQDDASMPPWGVLPLPDLFPNDDASLSTEEVYKVMKSVASFVVRTLPGFMRERAKTNDAFAGVAGDRPLHEFMPLPLPQTAEARMTSYKSLGQDANCAVVED